MKPTPILLATLITMVPPRTIAASYAIRPVLDRGRVEEPVPESRTDVDRMVALHAAVKKDAAAILSVLKTLDGGTPATTAVDFLRTTKSHLDRNADAAEKLVADFRERLARGSADNTIGEQLEQELRQVRRFRVMTDEYLGKRAPAALEVATRVDHPTAKRASRPGPKFTGAVNLQFGSSRFSGVDDASQTAQSIGLNGRYVLSPTSALSLNLDRSSAVKQTPYTATRARAGYQAITSSGGRVDAYIGFRGYEDKVLVRSEHSDFNAGGALRYPVGAAVAVVADGEFMSRNYKMDGGNDFSGAQLNGKLRFGADASMLEVGMRSRFQSSDVSFLDYSRLMPQLNYRSGRGRDYFAARAEYEVMSYAADAETNNFNRARGDLVVSRGDRLTELSLIHKAYGNNDALSNVKALASVARRSGARSTRHSVAVVYHTNSSDAITNYVDVRSNINLDRKGSFVQSYLFGRVWMSSDRSHRLDWSGAFGLRIWKFKIGPSAGLRMLVNPDDFVFQADGNSWRVGGKLLGNFAVSRATLSVSARYEYTTAYNSQLSIDRTTGLVTRGSVETRNPTALQIAATVRVPVMRDLDIRVDIRSFDTKLDLNSMLSVGSVENRSQTQVLAGLVYRIAR